MNLLDDHDATDDALSRLGTRLRTDADRRPPDFDRLGARIHAERHRARLAVVAGCVAVVLLIGAAIGVRAGSDVQSLRVGDGDPASTEAPTSAVIPMWTVNASIPADPAAGEVWGIDIVFDPATWDFSSLNDVPALDPMRAFDRGSVVPIGSASFHDQPRMQVYWQGPGAREAAEAARDELAAMPGIVSVEIGQAEPTSRPPGTSGLTRSLPPTFPTTVAPVERPQLPDARPTQAEILADGTVTDDEYEAAFWSWVECVEDAGASVQVRGRDPDGRLQYSVTAGVQGADDCYQRLFMQVDMTWQLALDGERSSTTEVPSGS